MEISPILVQLGPIAVRWYSIMILLGVIAAIFVALREARRRGYNTEHIWGMLPWVLVLGIIGARLAWVAVSLKTVAAEGWTHIFSTWEGGISIQGAIIGGVLALIIYANRKQLSFFAWADVLIPGVALGQAIGRWGNFFNQELFGEPCNQPWCIPISDNVLANDPRYAQYAGTNTHFAPTFAYEMIWNLINFGLLLWLGRQKRFQLRTGDLLWIYLIFYSIGRFFLEDVRLDSAIVSGVKAPQVFAALTIVIAVVALYWRHRPGSKAPISNQGVDPEQEFDDETVVETPVTSIVASEVTDEAEAPPVAARSGDLTNTGAGAQSSS